MLSSVVIPAFSKTEILLECLERFTVQTCQDFEIIVVSDGCPEVNAFLRDYSMGAQKRPYQLRRFDTGYDGFGVALACNKGIYEANGEQIIIIGPDCLVTPTFIEQHQKYFELGLLVLGSLPCVELDELGCIDYVCMQEQRDVFHIYSNLEQLEFGLEYAWLTFSGNMSFAKEDALTIGGFDVETFLGVGGSDTDFGRRFALQFSRLKFIHNPAYHVGIMSNVTSRVRSTSNWNRTKLGELSNRVDIKVRFIREL